MIELIKLKLYYLNSSLILLSYIYYFINLHTNNQDYMSLFLYTKEFNK